MEMTPSEYEGWQWHFDRYPHGDWHTQNLLAKIISILSGMGSGKCQPIHQIAPWLESQDEREKREAEESVIIELEEEAIYRKAILGNNYDNG